MYRVYSPDRVPLGFLEQYTSMQWMRRWHAPGAFALKMPFTSHAWSLLERENLIASGNEAGIIEGRWLEHTEKDGATIVCKGQMLAGYTNRRILWGVVSASDTPENIMRQLVTDAMTAGVRAIPGLTVAASQGYGAVMEFQEENTNLLKVLTTLSERSGLGFDIAFAPEGLTFRVLQGLDRSAGQSGNSRAIFSRHFENVLAIEYTDDAQKYTNVAKVDVDNDGSIVVQDVGTATGRDRREIYVKASGLTKDANGNALSPLQQLILMTEKGIEKLKPIEENMSAEVDPFGNLKYKTDYDLGDIVTVVDSDWGLSQDLRITQVKEVHEAKGFSLDLTFGYSAPIKEIVRWMVDG